MVALRVRVLRSAADAARGRRVREADVRAGARVAVARAPRAPDSRADALRRLARRLPEEEPTARIALDLQRRLTRAPGAPFDAGAARAAAPDRPRRRADRHGRSRTRAPTRSASPAPSPARTRCRWPTGRRSLRRRASRRPSACRPGAPRTPRRLRARCGGLRDDAYRALRDGDLLVLPARPLPRTRLRAVKSRTTDPVSFALLDGAAVARFPRVARLVRSLTWRPARSRSTAPGCARAACRRGRGRRRRPPIHALGMLLGAGRAALFAQSVRDGSPEPWSAPAGARAAPGPGGGGGGARPRRVRGLGRAAAAGRRGGARARSSRYGWANAQHAVDHCRAARRSRRAPSRARARAPRRTASRRSAICAMPATTASAVSGARGSSTSDTASPSSAQNAASPAGRRGTGRTASARGCRSPRGVEFGPCDVTKTSASPSASQVWRTARPSRRRCASPPRGPRARRPPPRLISSSADPPSARDGLQRVGREVGPVPPRHGAHDT